MYAIQVLSHLPSPETVRVMAGFLDDDDYRKQKSGSSYGLSNMEEAGRVLISILENPPSTSKHHPAVWRQWRDEVEAGQMTFRLKGMEGEFNFQGRVEPKKTRMPKTEADGERARAEASGGRNEGKNSGSGDRSEAEGPRVWVWIAVGLLLLALIYGWICRVKKA